jgi:hypothetical protein
MLKEQYLRLNSRWKCFSHSRNVKTGYSYRKLYFIKYSWLHGTAQKYVSNCYYLLLTVSNCYYLSATVTNCQLVIYICVSPVASWGHTPPPHFKSHQFCLTVIFSPKEGGRGAGGGFERTFTSLNFLTLCVIKMGSLNGVPLGPKFITTLLVYI